MDVPPVLEARRLSKSFGGIKVVEDVDLRLRPGTIHVLIGPNGAGKTTLFHLITKFLKPSSGSITFQGGDITRLGPAEIARRGLARSFQISSTFGSMSVLENVRGAIQARRESGALSFWTSDARLSKYDEEAMQYLDLVGLQHLRSSKVSELSYGTKRAVELATTLALQPSLLLLDEPLAGIAREDVPAIVELIRTIAEGRTVLMVEHNLKAVEQLADTISVLARGRIIAEGGYDAVSRNPDVIRAYLGAAA